MHGPQDTNARVARHHKLMGSIRILSPEFIIEEEEGSCISNKGGIVVVAHVWGSLEVA